MKKLAIAISAVCLLEALCYLWAGWCAFSLFHSVGATVSEALKVAEDEATTGFVLFTAGLLHWTTPRLRLPLAVAGVLGGFYGAYYLVKSEQLLSWNILTGSVIAATKWSETILVVLGVMCIFEIALLIAKHPQ